MNYYDMLIERKYRSFVKIGLYVIVIFFFYEIGSIVSALINIYY